jgi:hypothetical protein
MHRPILCLRARPSRARGFPSARLLQTSTCIIAALAYLALAAAEARADGAEEEALRKARTRFEEGVAEAKAGDFEAARLSFAQAYTVHPSVVILWNLALMEEKTAHEASAMSHFKQYARSVTTEAERSDATRHIAALFDRTGHIDLIAPAGSLLWVDGAPVGTAPLVEPVDVAPGKHRVESRTPLGTQATDTEAPVGRVAHVSFVAYPPMQGSASATPTDAARDPAPDAAIDQRARSSANAAHPIRAARAVTVGALAAASAVAAGLAVYYGIQSNDAADHERELQISPRTSHCNTAPTAECEQLKNDVGAAHNDYLAAEGLWIAGAVLAAGALGSWLLWPSASDGDGASRAVLVHLVPRPLAGGIGVAADGRFW